MTQARFSEVFSRCHEAVWGARFSVPIDACGARCAALAISARGRYGAPLAGYRVFSSEITDPVIIASTGPRVWVKER